MMVQEVRHGTHEWTFSQLLLEGGLLDVPTRQKVWQVKGFGAFMVVERMATTSEAGLKVSDSTMPELGYGMPEKQEQMNAILITLLREKIGDLIYDEVLAEIPLIRLSAQAVLFSISASWQHSYV